MEQAFKGFSPQTAEFFLQLAVNNNKAFFNAHRAVFQEFVLEPLIALARDLGSLMHSIDPEFETRPVQGKALARLRRDTRFTKDKAPYRDNLWLGYRRPYEGNAECLGFYFDISAFGVSWGMGMYAPYRARMDEIRRNILARPGEFSAMVMQPSFTERFVLEGEAYKRPLVPTGDSVILDWCNRKCVAAVHDQPLDATAFSSRLGRVVEADFKALAPIYRLLRGMPRYA
ncbi:MAG: DUF2461 domain-containing protein [Bacillota bacterium]